MILIDITIQGTTPLIMNRFHEAAQQAASSGTRLVSVGERGTPREQAELKLYTREDGTIVLPQPNLFRCVIDAGQFFKAGKSKVTTMTSSMIPACVDIGGLDYPITHDQPWQVDVRPVVNPSTKGRILCFRPRFDDWKVSFSVEIDDALITVALIREIIDAAGKRIGLGDFRPARKGPFGKFVVTSWVEHRTLPKAA